MRSTIFAFALLLAACGTPREETIDAGQPSAIDAAVIDAPDAMPAPVSRPSAVVQSAGGGVATSAGHRLHVRIGAPQPLGRASADSKITTGPGAVPWGTP